MTRAVSVEELHHALGGEISRGKNGPQVLCPGPGHSHHDRSLAVTPAYNADGGFVVHSFAGDDPIVCKDHVRQKLGLPSFQPGNSQSRPSRTVVKTYDYTDDAGEVLFQVIRYEPKGFSQRRPDLLGGWINNLDGVRRVPYKLPELIESVANERPVFVVEGEKAVDALREINIPATCNPHGAGKWRDEYSEHFKGATVYILPDNDETGRDHAKQVEQWINELNSDQFPVREKATGNCRNWAGLPLLIFAKPRKAGQVQSNCGGSTLCST